MLIPYPKDLSPGDDGRRLSGFLAGKSSLARFFDSY